MTILGPHLPSKPLGGPTLVLGLPSDTASARAAARWGDEKRDSRSVMAVLLVRLTVGAAAQGGGH
jgi:hypothetical protein